MAFSGHVARLPLAQYGLVGSTHIGQEAAGALIDAQGLDLSEFLIGREGGSAKYNATPITGAPKIKALLDWWPTASLQRLLAVGTDGGVYRDTGAGTFPVTMKTGLNASMVPVWAQGGVESFGLAKKAFLTTGLNVVQVVDGDAVVTRDIAATKPADWAGTTQPRFLAPHGGRMWGGLQARIYGSSLTNHEDHAAANGAVQLPVGPGLGDFVQGGISFKELFYVWKAPLGAYVMDDSSLDVRNWAIRLLNESIGLAGPNALCYIDDRGRQDVLLVSEVAHLHLLSYIREGDIAASDLTIANDLGAWTDEHLEVDAAALAFAWAKYYPAKKMAIVGIRGRTAGTNTWKLYVDFNQKVPRIHYSQKDVVEALEIRRDAKKIGRPISGDATGTVWQLDQASKTKGGAAYDSRFQTAHSDFRWVDPSLGTRRKNSKFLEVVFEPKGQWDLALDTFLDGNYAETINFSMGFSGAVLGSFILGTDRLASEFIEHRRRRMRGSWRYLSLLGRMSLADGDFALQDLYVGFTAGSEKP